jgi:hypothetical protein
MRRLDRIEQHAGNSRPLQAILVSGPRDGREIALCIEHTLTGDGDSVETARALLGQRGIKITPDDRATL